LPGYVAVFAEPALLESKYVGRPIQIEDFSLQRTIVAGIAYSAMALVSPSVFPRE
jgi:hypothetical protein